MWEVQQANSENFWASSLSCHSTIRCGNNMIVFGGLLKKEKRSEVMVYHIDEQRWECVQTAGPKPTPRYCHTACIYRKPSNNNNIASNSSQEEEEDVKMVVFGGLGTQRLNDVQMLDITRMAWIPVTPAGVLPLERSHHSAVLFGHHMVIFGGLADTGQRLNDVHIVDLETMYWVRPLVSGMLPPPRLAHSAEIHANKMVIFGGYDGKIRMNDVYVLDFGTMRWNQPLLQGPPPTPRFGHTMTLCASKAIVYGGSSGSSALPYLDVLDLDTLTWTQINPTGIAPLPMHYHTGVLCGPRVYYFGGVKKFVGLYVLNLNSIDMLKIRDFQEAKEFVDQQLELSFAQLDSLLNRKLIVDDPPTVAETVNFVRQKVINAFSEMRGQLARLLEEEERHRRHFAVENKKLETAIERFEEQKCSMAVIGQQQQSKVCLNIGGQRYETSVATLAKDGDSMLAAMFSGLYVLKPDPVDGAYFIDRDGTNFRYILNFLRDGTLHVPNEMSLLRELVQEAEFYQIKGLVLHLKYLIKELISSDEE